MSGFDEIDFFTDQSLVDDPYPYFEYLRSRGPVCREPHHGVVAVTGYDEAAEVFRNSAVFSSCNSVTGPFPGLPFEPEGDDIGALIERFRDQFPLSEYLVTFDAPRHTAHRELLRRLFTPGRLRENEAFMWRLADRQIDEFIEAGKVELLSEYAKPFALLVIADLLGVPQDYHETFRIRMGARRPGALVREQALSGNPMLYMERQFTEFVEDRRRRPRDDVLTALATATFPDGSLPEVIDVVRVATLLFAAGQETTTRLLCAALAILAEDPALQRLLRCDRTRIPAFVEETLRMESPVKADFRLARTSTTLGGVSIPAGTTVMVLTGAVNRDPARFECPGQFRADRPHVREHMSFGRGAHSCPGGALARVEARVSIERLLDRMADIRVCAAEHGPAGARRFAYEPTYVLRGVTALHLEYTAVA